jgi:hypothetical protein
MDFFLIRTLLREDDGFERGKGRSRLVVDDRADQSA